MDKLCGSCKWWGEPTDTAKFRQCKCIKFDAHGFVDDYNEWIYESDDEYDIKKRNEINEFRKINLAVVQDGSGYAGCMKCREDFGCVLWESK